MTTAVVPFVTWTDALKIGVQEIDDQHKRLVSQVNQLHEAMAKGHSKDVLGGILDSLVQYTKTHFTAEELLMQRSGYPEIVAHKQEHALLVARVVNFQRDFAAGRIGLSVEVMQFLGSWLKGHIQGTDRKYVPSMHAIGIR